ncbi:arylesterase [Sulfitobacter donghicola]|uniref:GDSL family lipase n=1 Tax=Sulfitobacter donghicola DSW-25 = KCTC 12864 = JCM 14565 TaxID=1300350 RepID=A0A073IHZ8_9RHOB|nr:arylesterase [Sulfitobacter donghicola]KEJ89111.1 GDSL family lipase [Sulfitobacter donghicola DSW-25 = KCTC 12864 = JCM 14565]KIN67312.1 Acyl-CoA thioesterase [Sulfitobacter donghicola DSW-25 = KCTC 12864 = JCM 14565]
MRKVWVGILMFWAGLAQAEEVVIAALGDSLTQGFGLTQAEGFVPQLETWIQSRDASVRLINAGVSGDTTAGGLARVAWTLQPEVDGLIVALGGNDLLRGIDPNEVRKNMEGIMRAAQTAQVPVLLIGMQASNNFGTEYKADFDRVFPELAKSYDAAFLPSFFAGLSDGEGPQDPAALRQWFQADGIHPNADGVSLIVEAVGPKLEGLIAKIDAVGE